MPAADCRAAGRRERGCSARLVEDGGTNAFGLYDMSGNAYQLVQDCYQANYNGAPTDGSARGGGVCPVPIRVVRGGSWRKTLDWGRSASRFLHSADMRTDEVGFRVARTLR